MKKHLFLFLLFSTFCFGQVQTDYLEEGNRLLSENQPQKAEQVFLKALETAPDDLIFQNQLALSLIDQEKNEKAQTILNNILKKDAENTAALWYSGINQYTRSEPHFKEALIYFQKAAVSLDETSPQFYAVNYYIGHSYKKLLYTEGLSYNEVDKMLEALTIYKQSVAGTSEEEKMQKFIDKIKAHRPPENVAKWLLTTADRYEKTLQNVIK